MTLAARLDAIRDGAAKRIPEATLATMHEATRALRASGILDGVIKPGAVLPPFRLANSRGEAVSSDDLLARGAIVLTVFRGHW